MARPELGMKRQCMNCGAKFYDLTKDPIVCPKCGTAFQAAAAAPARAAAPVAAARRPVVEEPEVEAAGPEMVSLEEVEAGEAEKDPVIEDDIEVAADVGGEDTFLEAEEEGDDDVAGLIDGDIEDDEEA
ncbi:MAG TPA: TIGR02300 family protein [Beijerinckiaceae bacterium]|nr:TIGR02300 family protein [Beijerinckiaceae bacterium]